MLTQHDHPFRRTHDIGELAVACLAYRPEREDLLRSAAPFTEYAWRFRYPGEIFELPIEEVRHALTIAADVVAVVSSAGPSVH